MTKPRTKTWRRPFHVMIVTKKDALFPIAHSRGAKSTQPLATPETTRTARHTQMDTASEVLMLLENGNDQVQETEMEFLTESGAARHTRRRASGIWRNTEVHVLDSSRSTNGVSKQDSRTWRQLMDCCEIRGNTRQMNNWRPCHLSLPKWSGSGTSRDHHTKTTTENGRLPSLRMSVRIQAPVRRKKERQLHHGVEAKTFASTHEMTSCARFGAPIHH